MARATRRRRSKTRGRSADPIGDTIKNQVDAMHANTRVPRRPKALSLPGMEDRAFAPLEEVAAAIGAIKDQREKLNEEEKKLHTTGARLMRQFGKDVYRHDGLEITLVRGDDHVKFRIKKPAPAADGAAAAD